MGTSTPLSVLLVEDDERDAQAAESALVRGGYAPTVQWARTRDDYEHAVLQELAHRTYDVVICDYRLYDFNAKDALTFLHSKGLTLPFVAVTGQVDEELLVDLIRAGASTYLFKNRIWALASAVTTALNLAVAQREQQQVEAFLRAYREELFNTTSDTEGIYAGYEREHARLKAMLAQTRQKLQLEH